MIANRKGYSRRADIPAELLAALNAGTEPTATLSEALSIDFVQLMRACAPDAAQLAEHLLAGTGTGITQRMLAAGKALSEIMNTAALEALQQHKSDTVRGWVAYAWAQRESDLEPVLSRLRPLADDPHFGVREWVWMAFRPHLEANLAGGLQLLEPWVREPSANLRRFAVEGTRPRGVWCAHLEPLKQAPEAALHLLAPLKADESRYVQDSVANWLNDAAKTRAEWVRNIVQQWHFESKAPATAYICKRALRSL